MRYHMGKLLEFVVGPLQSRGALSYPLSQLCLEPSQGVSVLLHLDGLLEQIDKHRHFGPHNRWYAGRDVVDSPELVAFEGIGLGRGERRNKENRGVA